MRFGSGIAVAVAQASSCSSDSTSSLETSICRRCGPKKTKDQKKKKLISHVATRGHPSFLQGVSSSKEVVSVKGLSLGRKMSNH